MWGLTSKLFIALNTPDNLYQHLNPGFLSLETINSLGSRQQ